VEATRNLKEEKESLEEAALTKCGKGLRSVFGGGGGSLFLSRERSQLAVPGNKITKFNQYTGPPRNKEGMPHFRKIVACMTNIDQWGPFARGERGTLS